MQSFQRNTLKHEVSGRAPLENENFKNVLVEAAKLIHLFLIVFCFNKSRHKVKKMFHYTTLL
jgi:hypothetical protein